jgi:sporulation protein YlmC with PRC-barrel domain
MTTPARWDNLIGATVVGSDGGKLGNVGQIYLDEATGQPAWVTVRTGLSGTRQCFAPLHNAAVSGDQVILAVPRDLVTDAPNIENDGRLDESETGTLYQHYAGYLGHGGQQSANGGYAGSSTQTVAEGTQGRDTSGPATDDAMTRRHQCQPQQCQPGQLAARLESLARIEQAKAIIMAKIGCTEVQAFDILRAVSQGRNVPVRDLATQLVDRAARNQPLPGADPQTSGRNGDRGQALLDVLSTLGPGQQEKCLARSPALTARLLELVAACDICNKQHTFRGTASEIADAARSWSQTHQCTTGRP